MKSSPVLLQNQTAIDDAGPFEKMVSFEISSSELQQAMSRVARRISREVSIPGFRPGRAPRRLVERRVGVERVKSDALDELIPARVGEILSETEIVPAVAPLLESTTDTANGAVKLEVRVTTWPRLASPPDYRGRRIQVPSLPPISEEVDDRLQRLVYLYAPLQTVERQAGAGDFVVIDMTVTEGERPIESLALDGFSYELGSARLTPEIDDDLLGRRAGDEFETRAPLPEWLPADDSTEGDLENHDDPAMGVYAVRVVEVQSRLVPDLDDEWASEYTGHDTLDDLRQEMGDEIEQTRNSEQWDALVEETISEAVSEMELELPERLEMAQTEMLFRRHLVTFESAGVEYSDFLERTGREHEAFIEELRQRAVLGLKSRILTESVIRHQGLVVEDAEVVELLEDTIRQSDDPESARQQVDRDVDFDRVRIDMLTVRAHAFLAMQVEPVDEQGEPVPVTPPDRVKAWFEPGGDAVEISDTGRQDDPEPLYEAEVIG